MPRILITGANGLIGRALARSLEQNGSEVVRLVRQPGQIRPGAILWDPENPDSLTDTSPIEGCAAAVHLAGANLASHRWTDEYKNIILNSRVDSSRTLVRILSRLTRPPDVLVSASATGIYGDRGDEILTERSAIGTGFLPEVCDAWEKASAVAASQGIRVVHLRFGVVLSSEGGALQKLLPIFRAGFGGKLSNGRTWMSWVSLPDAISAVGFALRAPAEPAPAATAYNVVAPEPATNAEWTAALARKLHRPAIFRVPAAALGLAYGQMARDTILASSRVLPERLVAAGFHFAHPSLESALGAVL